MIETRLQDKLKPGLEVENFQKDGAIYLSLNPDYLSGDNAKYMTMYNRMARWYDMSEKWIGPLLHGKAIDKLRRDLMEKSNGKIIYLFFMSLSGLVKTSVISLRQLT